MRYFRKITNFRKSKEKKRYSKTMKNFRKTENHNTVYST